MKKLHISMAGKRAVNGYLFILPWLLGFLLFYVRSLYMTVEFSLSDLTVLSTGGYNLEFVGLKNYYEAFFSHASFKQTLTTSIGNMLIDVPLIIFFSLFVAMMLNRKMKCRGLVRAIFFLPVLLGAEAVSNALSLAAQMMAGGAERHECGHGGGVGILRHDEHGLPHRPVRAACPAGRGTGLHRRRGQPHQRYHSGFRRADCAVHRGFAVHSFLALRSGED